MRTRNPELMRREVVALCDELAPMLAPSYRAHLKLFAKQLQPSRATYRWPLPDELRRAGNALIEIKRGLAAVEHLAAEAARQHPDDES